VLDPPRLEELTYFALAFAYQTRRALRESIRYYEQALEHDPADAVAYNNICSAYNDLEMWDEAASACRRALEIDPDLVRARNNLTIAEKREPTLETP
jgi:tetratricopeptide (TPR) repeat protein